MELREPTTKDVQRLAARIHRCPEGYDGPCWGPTDDDRALAKHRLTVVMNCPEPANHGPDGPFHYCPCGWTEEWGFFAPKGD